MTKNTHESQSVHAAAADWLHDEYVDKVNAAVARGDNALAAELSEHFADDDADGLMSARLTGTVERLIQLVR
jgi:hypothetical protein